MHLAQAALLQPPALIQAAPGQMGVAAAITPLANVDALPDGSRVRLPAHPMVQVSTLRLAPGERVVAPERLLLRQALVQQGQLMIEPRGGGRPQRLEAGQWALDDGRQTWSAADGGGAQVLVVQHLRRPDRSAPAPGPQASVAPGGPPVSGSHASAPGGPPVLAASAQTPPRPAEGLFTSDYVGEPITMPDGPLRLLVNRYVIREGANLPWHLHPEQRYAYVESGSIRVEDERGNSQVYAPGQMLVEQRQVVHRGINLGQGEVSLLVFDYVPRGVHTNTVVRTSAP